MEGERRKRYREKAGMKEWKEQRGKKYVGRKRRSGNSNGKRNKEKMEG